MVIKTVLPLLLLLLGKVFSAQEVCLECATPPECSLYLAPSSIPGAGLGVYTAIDVSEDDFVGEPDLFVPVIDKFKTLPFRGQQQFLSWLGYVWPEKQDHFYNATTDSFPTIPPAMYKVDPGLNGATTLKFYDGDGKRISVFAPGIASMANSHLDRANIKKLKSDLSGNEVKFFATQDIPAGSELLLNYGRKWHKRLKRRQKSETEYETLENYEDFLEKKRLPTVEDKRRKLAKQKRRKLAMDDDDEYDDTESNNEKVKSNKQGVEKRGGTEDDDYEDENDNGEEDSSENVEWLKKNGVCLDNLRAGSSGGAVAKNFIPKGQLVAPAPLLVLKRRIWSFMERTRIKIPFETC